jgi:membrane protein DedA with SNARE-associated domain/rhodanese-related sulfurtransferase
MQNLILMIERYGLVVVFFNVLLEQAGLPLPSYPVLMIATTLAVGATGVAGFSAGGMSALPAILLVGIAGALIADVAWFVAARRYGRRVLITLCRISLSPDSCVRQTESTYKKFGPLSLTFAKFVPGLTNVAVALAGLTKTPPAVFIICDLIGAVLFVGAAIVLGLFFRGAIADVLFVLDALGRLGLVVLAATLGLYLAAKWWQRQRFVRQLRMDRITVDELRILIADGAKPVILDVRSNELRAREGLIPGSVPANMSELDPVLREYPRDTEVVVYCSCPNEASAAIAARHLKRAGFTKIRPLLGGIEAWSIAGQPVTSVTAAV